MTATTGTIYYTTDGTDPRLPTTIISTILVDEFVPATAKVATQLSDEKDAFDTDWRELNFVEPVAWSSGNTAVGYDTDPNGATGVEYTTLLGIDVETEMSGLFGSVFVRVPFTVTDPNVFDTLALRMRYDDGFVAYLNGTEVASFNAPGRDGDPGTLAWDSLATDTHGDVDSIVPEIFDITANLNLLQVGNNVLAIQGLNTSLASSDLLVLPELIAGQITSNGISIGASESTPGTSIPLTSSTNFKARAVVGDPIAGDWSALSSALFVVDTPLRVSEIMYNPTNNDAVEFIELVNTSDNPILLAGIRFDGSTEGIEFTFDSGEPNLPGHERIVVVRNQNAFATKYNSNINYPTAGMRIALGQYDDGGTKLSNDGETLTLLDPLGGMIQQFTYNDVWYKETDGDGFSLVIVETAGDYNDPANWRSSAQIEGSPSAIDPDALATDFNGDGTVDQADLAILLQNYGTTSGANRADGNANPTSDEAVNLQDLLLVKKSFGDTISSSPPPAAAAEALVVTIGQNIDKIPPLRIGKNQVIHQVLANDRSLLDLSTEEIFPPIFDEEKDVLPIHQAKTKRTIVAVDQLYAVEYNGLLKDNIRSKLRQTHRSRHRQLFDQIKELN